MSNLLNLTRGGQIQLNNFRMFFQVANKVIVLSSSVFIISVPVCWCLFAKNPIRQLYLVEQHYMASYCYKTDMNIACKKALEFSYIDGKKAMVPPGKIFDMPAVRTAPKRALQNLIKSVWIGGGLSLITLVGLLFYLVRRGVTHNKKNLIKGAELLDAKAYTQKLKSSKLDSDLKIGGVPMVKDSETQHILIHGSPGTGKTVCMNQILEQVRAKGQKAIVYDIKGAFVPAYYRPGKDIILNPLDERSPSWNLWKECGALDDYQSLANSLVQENTHQTDSFWLKAARMVLSSSLSKFSDNPDMTAQEFLSRLFSMPMKKVETLLRETMASHMVKSESERMAYSVMASLASDCQSLIYLKDHGKGNSFSIREWLRTDNDSWLFINSSLRRSENIKPIISFWLDIAIKHFFDMPESRTRRLWFLFDEFARLQRLPSLETLLSMGRGYGACFVGAIQDINQLRDLYGDRGADSLVGSCGTKLFFASNSARTSEWAANELSKVETLEMNTNYSMGAHQMRDGIALNQQRRHELLVLPCEILKQPKLKAYMTTMGVESITQLEFKPKDMPNNYPAVVERDLSGLSFELKFKIEEPKEEAGENLTEHPEEVEPLYPEL